ncbi:MAG: TraB/GumN family protein [Bdellovibrionaceae bacterium]|nr:TraB/GumN family protein [Bdellovibrio sp.]
MLLTLILPIAAKAQSAYQFDSSFKQTKPFLFEIEKDGKISHILGSMHVGIPLTSFPVIVFELAAQSKSMAFEADAELFKKNNREAMHAAALYPPEDSLDKNLTRKATLKLRELFDHGQGIEHLMKYRSWAIASELDADTLKTLQESDGAAQWDVLQGIDMTLLNYAKQVGRPITYLDDLSRKVEEFNENTSAQDLEKLLSYPNPRAHLLQCARMAQSSYLKGNESGFILFNELCENEIFLKRVETRTIFWIAKLENLFNEGGAFVTVGAGHMDGPNGLKALLTLKGYKVRRLDAFGNPVVTAKRDKALPTQNLVHHN